MVMLYFEPGLAASLLCARILSRILLTRARSSDGVAAAVAVCDLSATLAGQSAPLAIQFLRVASWSSPRRGPPGGIAPRLSEGSAARVYRVLASGLPGVRTCLS